MGDPPRMVLRPNPSITTEQVRDARSRAWAFVFRCYESRETLAAKPAPEPDSRDDAAEVKHKEEVNHVAQLNDRRSKIVTDSRIEDSS